MGIIVTGAIFLLSIFGLFSQNNNSEQEILTRISETKVAQTKIEITPTDVPKNPDIHIVAPGDTLQKISKQYYGSANHWTTIWNDNSWIEDFRIIQTGWELKIRPETPIETEQLNEKLATVYEEITNPTLTPVPTNTPQVAGTQNRALGSTGSFDEVYKQAGSRFGIPWEILYGLHLIETGLRDGPISNGSGPQGPLQFLPGTWALYGVDGNGDGTADINNAVDAIFGAANYLASHGGVEQGLRTYGNVIDSVYSAARSRGWGG